MHERQQISVDVAGEVRHLVGAPGEQHLTVGVGEHQQRCAVGVGGVGGFELITQDVEWAKRSDGAECGGVVAPIHVGGPSGEPAATELVVFLAVEVGVRPPGRLAFAQVNERFHRSLH